VRPRSTASGVAVAGLEESSLRALTKLQQVLPARLASRVDAFRGTMLRVGPPAGQHDGAARSGQLEEPVDGGLLAVIAAAARDREIVRFAYVDHAATRSERRVEPYRLVSMARRWYLVAFDIERQDWRIFRVDRMDDVRSVGHRFRERELPAPDVAAYVAARSHQVQKKVRGTVIVHAPAEVVREGVGWWADSTIEPLDESRCRLRVGGTSLDSLAFWLGGLGADFEVVDSPELAEAVRRLAQRYARAA